MDSIRQTIINWVVAWAQAATLEEIAAKFDQEILVNGAKAAAKADLQTAPIKKIRRVRILKHTRRGVSADDKRAICEALGGLKVGSVEYRKKRDEIARRLGLTRRQVAMVQCFKDGIPGRKKTRGKPKFKIEKA